MALGNYDNNRGNDQYIPAYYSAYNTGNQEGIDPSSLNYSFYNRMLKLSISPLKMNSGDKVAYDHENAAIVWLTHTKARMLHNQILRVLNGELTNGGVNTGKEGLIRFSDGKELGINNYCLIINKINENGECVSSYAYEFKTKYHYAVDNFDPKDASHKKHYDNQIEIDQLLTLLQSYYESMSGALAYSVMDGMRFTTNAQNTKMDLIMSKLGIDFKPGTSSRRSFFDNENDSSQSNRNMRSATMEDLED